ncbi:MAG: hypothetical protein JNM21_02170 [Taibaiella sp.]|nr:hypothetical protein [Taibaiella sp.]
MNLRQILNNSKIGLSEKLNYIKTKEEPKKFYSFFKKNTFFKNFLNNNLFLNNINSIKHNEPYAFTGNFNTEIYWIYSKVKFNYQSINQFLELKDKIDNYILLSKYKDARELLDIIINNFGYSLWSIETDLLISENELGSSENWQSLSQYLSSVQNSFYEFCINFSSKKVEDAISFESFVAQLQNDINSVNAFGFIRDFFVFKNFKFANYNYDYEDLTSILYVSNIFSIFDQYNLLIDVIAYNISKNKAEYFNLFLSITKDLIDLGIKDNRLVNIHNLLSNTEYIEVDFSENIYIILENFYLGNYSESFKLCDEYIRSNALEFEVYEIYVKSLIMLNRKFEKTEIYSIDCILEDLYELLHFSKDSEKYIKRLHKAALKNSNSNLGLQIMDFLSEIDGNKQNFSRYEIYSSYNSYKICLKKEKKIDIQQCCDIHKYNFYQYKRILLNINNADVKKYKSNDVNQVLNAEIIFNYNNQNYNNVINLISNEIFPTSITYLIEKHSFYLYNSYLNEGRIEECLALFGNLFFDDSTLYLKISFEELYKKTFDDTDKYKYINNVQALVLFSLFNSEYDLYEMLDEFLSLNNIEINNLTELNILLENLNITIYVFNKVCSIDTIKYFFSQIEKVEELRIKILDELILIDSKNKSIYETEIIEINRKISVRKVIKEVNNGRLFVDVPKLKEQLVEKYKDDFNRLFRIVDEKKNNILLGFNSSKPRNWEKSLKEQDSVDIDKYSDADFIAFKAIYYDVREQFLFSKEYGLDSCLSTRIRHGSLENQIRSVFESSQLVTTKLEDNYIDSEFWNSEINDHQINKIIQAQIKEFSKKVDEYNSFLKNEIVQISNEKIDKPNAIFSYFTNDEILYSFYYNHVEFLKSTEDIIDILLNDLSNYTNFNLCFSIYKYFTQDVYSIYNKFVTEFSSNISINLSDVYIHYNLNKSLTDLQICLEEIGQWFSLETSSSSNLLFIEDIINASFELTRKLYKNIEIISTLKMDFTDVAGYSSLIYVFNIIFSNCIIHSGLDELVNIYVNVSLEEDKYVKIDIKNNYLAMDRYLAEYNLKKIKDEWKNFENIERSNIEGESGFHKIKRIMIYEAKCITDKFDYIIDDNSVTVSLYLIYKKSISNENTNN